MHNNKNFRRVRYLKVNTDMLSKNSARRLRRELQKISPDGQFINMIMLRGYIVTLGLKVLEDTQDGTGEIPKFEWHKSDIADTLSWRGDPELLFKALVQSGWLIVMKDCWLFPQIKEAADDLPATRRREKNREIVKKSAGRRATKKKATRKKKVAAPLQLPAPQVEEKRLFNPDALRLVPVVVNQDPNEQVAGVVDFYRLKNPTRGRQLQPGHRDWKIILSRLREGYTVDELRKAVIGNNLCEWHLERKLHGVTDVFRNADKVAKFIAIAEGGLSPRPMSKVERETKEFLDLERAVDKVVDGGTL